MKRSIAPWAPQLYAILRIAAGLMFAMHGTQKLFGWPGEGEPASAELMIAAGVIEAAAGVAIAIGFFTRWAAFIASGEMAVAYFKAHFPADFLPLLNRGELAVLYCFLFLFIAAHGAGMWSVDDA